MKNRLKDIQLMTGELKEKKSLSVKFKYVQADLLTWRITLENYGKI